MSSEISFCPQCAGKLDSEKGDRFVCDDCETRFFIQVVDDDDDEDDEDEDDEEKDDDEEEEEKDDEDEY